MKFKDIKKEERPREKLIKYGAHYLTDYELLAIMLGSGTRDCNVIDFSIELINQYGLEKLLRMSYLELRKIKGVKEAKATKLMACFELSKRCVNNNININVFEKAEDVYNFVKSDYMFLKDEYIMVIYVDIKCRPIYKKMYNNKNVSKVELPIKEIIKDGIDISAYGLFLIHNHPSGDVNPSITDINTTTYLLRILKSIDLIFLDHIIIGNEEYYSFDENNILK